MSQFFRILCKGSSVTTPLLAFWTPSLTVQDPEIPNLSLEDPAVVAATFNAAWAISANTLIQSGAILA